MHTGTVTLIVQERRDEVYRIRSLRVLPVRAGVRWWVGMVVRFVCPCFPCVSRLPPVSFYR